MEHWLKKFSKNLPQNTFKTIFDTFGNDFGHFWSFGNFLKTFRRLDPPWNTGQKNFSKELPQNMFKTRLDNFGRFWNLGTTRPTILGVFWILKIFQKRFEDSTLHGTPGKKYFRKIYPKTCSKHFWTIWERFCALLEFWKNFLKTFQRLDPPWNTEQKNFFEKLPQNMFRTRWTTIWERNFWEIISKTRPSMEHFFEKSTPNFFWTILGVFGILTISKTRPSMEHWAKKFFEKITPKHVQNTIWERAFWNFEKYFKKHFDFGTLGKKNFSKNLPQNISKQVLTFWERFWAFLEFCKISDFLKPFRRLDPPWNTGQKNSRKNYPKTCSKHVWTIWERFWAFLEFWNFFKNISKTRPSMEHWAKKFSKKVLFKTRLGTFLGTILGKFWNFLIYWKTYIEDSTLLGTLGKKRFERKLPQNMFKARLDTFGNDFGRFLNFENFLKTFRRLDLPWNTGQKKFLEKSPPKHVLDNLGTKYF